MPLFTTFPAEPISECYGLELAAGGGTGVVSQNTVYLYLVRILGVTTITNMRTHCGGTAAGHIDMGFYTLDGNTLLGHIGVTATSASTTISPALLANVTLSPGFYWSAFGSDSATDTFSRAGTIAVPGATSSIRWATNAYSSGLPSSLGTILAPNGAIPVWTAVSSGGLP